MKITVINNMLQQRHKDRILKTAGQIGAEVCFAASESDIPPDFSEPEIIYGYGTGLAGTDRNLKWLCVPSAGVDFLLKPGYFANPECLVSNSSGAYGAAIAEHIIAVSLMLMRRITEFHVETLRGEWGKPRLQRSLIGSRITALGTGDIGCSFAKRVRAFEPKRLVGISRSGRCRETVFDVTAGVSELDDILKETDLLVMSLPDTPDTRGILSGERIRLLPEGAYVVNVGRGSAVDEDALAEALNEGRLAGAALDVFQKEPLPAESRLWHTKNLLITPHTAGNLTVGHTLDRNVEMFCEDLLNYGGGHPLKYLVDRNRGY